MFGCTRRRKLTKTTRQTAKEKRRNSRSFKKKRFELHKSALKAWRQGLKERRATRAARKAQKEEMEIVLSLVSNNRKRRIKTALDCPLDTCPKKIRLLAKMREFEGSTTEDESDGNTSTITHFSGLEGRHRSPIRVARRH